MCDAGISNEAFSPDASICNDDDDDLLPQRWRCNSYDTLSENYDRVHAVTDDDYESSS
jgi:hypothetical protein